MPQFQNSPKGFASVRNRIILRVIPIQLIIIVGASIILYFTGSKDSTNLLATLFAILIMAGIFCYSIVKVINQQKENYLSFRLTVDKDFLSCSQKGQAGITLFFSDIKNILKDKHGNLFVKGKNTTDSIAIPADIESYEQVQELLQTVLPITSYVTKKWLEKYPYLLPIATVVLMVAVYSGTNKVLVFFSGLILIALLTWSFYKINANRQLKSSAKRILWYLPIIVISIIVAVYYKVFMQ